MSAIIEPASITVMTIANVASDIFVGAANSHRTTLMGMTNANAVAAALTSKV
jgi:hypothetical protein